MGLFDSLTTAVSGLSSQSYALQNISGNIANSQTTAFKRLDTRFENLIGDNIPSKQISGGVLASSAPTNNVQGDIQNATTSTFMALNGNGYFIVQKPTSFSGSVPVFSGVNVYTRRGDFQPDQNGYMVNSAGYYLMGVPLDPTTGMPSGSIPITLQFSNNLIPAQETSQIQYNANLPSQPVTVDTKTGVVDSNLLDPAKFASNPLVGGQGPATVQGTGASMPAATVTAANDFTIPNPGDSFVLTSTLPTTPPVSTPVTVTIGTDADATALVNDINAQLIAAGVPQRASVSGTKIVITGDAKTQFTIAAPTPPATDATGALGFTAAQRAATYGPTNLTNTPPGLSGTLTVANGASGTPATVTFGTGPGQISTLAGLVDALNSQFGTSPVASVDGNGNLRIVGDTQNVITLNGSTALLASFGITNSQAFPGNLHVYGVDQTNFLNESVAGGSITCYDGTGTPVDMQFRWAKTQSTTNGGTDTWNLFYQSNSSASNTQPAWTNVGTSFTFNSVGQLAPPIQVLTLNNVTVNGQALGNVSLNFGNNGLTQYSNTSGTVQVNLLNQNGSSAGTLQSIAVDDQSRIIGTYSNGRTVPLAQVSLVTFNGQNALKQLDGGAYQATADSGPPLMNATAKIVGSSLEASNADIADEFSKLIVTQQAYSANTKIITTVNQMSQDLLNVIR